MSVLAVKLWETAETLEQRLDNPTEILEMLVSALAKGEEPGEVWTRLHEAAQRHDRLADLAFSYEHVVADKRIKLLPTEQQAFIFLRAAEFCADLFGDSDGAIKYAERATHAVPGHPQAFGLLERLLIAGEKTTRLAELYIDASTREADIQRKLALLQRAAELLQDQPSADDLAIDVGQRILKIIPGDAAAREALVRRLLARGRHKDVVDVFEQALRCDPPPPESESVMIRELLVDLCLNELKDGQRALAHVEGLLHLVPNHPTALKYAEGLLDNRNLSLRAAAALSDAYEKSGRTESAIGMLTFELKQVRGPRRVEVQRRLGILRQDALNDPAGALELLGPVVAGDPGDDALRQRFVALSLSLNQFEQAARLLARALQTSRDVGVRARVGVDVGHVYLKTGDLKRAQQAFQQALDAGHDDGAMLEAARQLSDLYAEGDLKQLLYVLEIVVKLEPEKELRQAAARRLARLSDNESSDPERAIVAYKALIGSPWSDEALRRLETLYRDVGDEEGLADVLFHRAERTKDPGEARKLAFQAAELASARTRNPDAAIAAWQRLAERYGASSEILERIVPLLEQAQRYPELAALLEQELASAEPSERVGLLVRLAQLRQTRIGDLPGALQNFGEALALDPAEPTARAAVEKLLGVPEARELAAQILEPLYRTEEPNTGLIRVLEARAEVATDALVALAALGEAADLSAQALRDPVRALDLAGRGLAEAVVAAPEQVHEWLDRVQTLSLTAGDPARRVRLLSNALGNRAVDSAPLLELARATGDALAAAGEISAAMDAFRRALAFDPSSRELMQRVDQVLAQQGEPEERLFLYRAALEQEADTVRRRELLHAIATLQRRELNDLQGALQTWRAAVAADASDLGAREALVDALEEAGELPDLAAELERALELAEGERRNLALLRLAEVRSKLGDASRALAHYCELMKSADLADDVLEMVEQLAREQNDGETIRMVIERRLQHTSDPAVRAALLERLGNALAWQLGDSMAAAQAWLEGAHLGEGAAHDAERARRLYERVLGAMPEHVEAAERVVELGVGAGDWEGVHEPFEVLLRALDERDIVAILLGLEERALGEDGAKGYVGLVDLALAREIQPFRARHVLLAKARAQANMAGGIEQAAAIFRKLLEGAGDEAVPDADAFEAFLNRAELTPERIEDYRWLFRWRLDRTSDPASVLFAWAQAEEHTFGDSRAAAKQYERVVGLDPERLDAISELARLRAAEGDAAGALESFRTLRDRCDVETRPAVDLKMAGLYVTLGKTSEALELVTPILSRNASDVEALRVVYHALSAPESRARAAAVLERVAESSEDPAARADVIEALLKASAEAPELAEAHSRWLKQLLETKSDEPEEALRLSLRGAEAAPGEDELWNVAEQMARKLNQPGPVAEAYARTVERQLSPEIADSLGRRMVEFYEEWFDDAERVVQLLQRVLGLCPSATWAFERLKLAFNAAGRWEELFSLYNARLEEPIEVSEQIDLLREAAMAARDFAGDPERAIGYFERLNRLSPGDHRIESSLERLYERHSRKRPLIDLLSVRLEGLKEAERGELIGRIAALWLDLGEPAPAFELAERLLLRPEEVSGAVSLLERIVTMPESRGEEGDEGPSVRERAAAHLKTHYRGTKSIVDVVRMLHVQAESAVAKQRVKLLEEIVSLSLEELNDELGAFETLASLVLLEPDAPRHRKAFAGLAERLTAHDRRAETLVAIADQVADPAVQAGLLSEAGDVYRVDLALAPQAIDLYRRVLALGREDKPVALHAARELTAMLRGGEHVAEHVSVLEQLADLEASQKAKRVALGEAAALALSALSDPERAIRAWRARLEIGKRDFEAVDGLCQALERAARWEELIVALESHAELSDDEAGARRDRVRIAEICAEVLRDAPRAVQAWEGVRRRHGRSPDSFEALHRLQTAQAAWPELARLLEEEVAQEADATRRQSLHSEIGELHRQHTGDLLRAIEAFVAASSWDRAIEVAGTNHGNMASGRQNCEALLSLAVEVWGRGDGDVESAAKAADWAIGELSDRLLEASQYDAVVAQLLRGAELPFAQHRRRELRRDAACLCSDRLSDDARAIELFKGLLTEDPGDDVARASVTRLALLLEEQGRHDEVVGLWEQQAKARSDGGDSAGAAVLWARAGDLAEQRLGDLPRAIEDFTAGAKLRGEASLEALARIYKAQGDHIRAASVLAVLCEQSSPEELAARALELADAYGAVEDLGRARSALEHAVGIAAEPAKLRTRLAGIYRQVRDYAALAKLLSEEASRAPDKKTQLAILREAASLHQNERSDPASAVPLLERAIELDPDDQKQRLQLAQALYMAARYDDAAIALRDQIQRYGSRKPKDRALAHFQLARVLLSAGNQVEALGELDAASKIDPASPAIMQMLARVAFEQGELDRAERMYRALLLVVGRDDDADAPSKADALIALSETAARRDDPGRAAEFIESAFEAALESPREASALEMALRHRGRYDLLSRALETRLGQRLEPSEAARALADLVVLHADNLGDLAAVHADVHARAQRLEREIEAKDVSDDAAWSALGRVYDHLGDSSREAAILERRIAAAASRSSRSPADADLFFRLARAKLQDERAADQGLEFLERALDISGDFSRAQAQLAVVQVGGALRPRLSALYERVARAMGDGRALVSALSIQVALPGVRAQTVREAVEAAKSLGEAELVVQLLKTALENPEASFEPDEDAGLRLELASCLERSGDLQGALDLRELAAPHLPREEARMLLLAIAQAAAADPRDLARALRVYERLRRDEPANRELWQPLLALHRTAGPSEEMLAVLEQTIPLVDDRVERSQLRLEQIGVELGRPDRGDHAIELLRQAIEDDPSQREPRRLLRELLVKKGRSDEIINLLRGDLDQAKDQADVAAISAMSKELATLLEGQGKVEEALDVCRSALEWDGAQPELLEAMARLAEATGDPLTIADALEALLRVERGERAAALSRRLSALREEQGDREGAERALELGFKASPADASLRDLLIVRYGDREEHGKVAELLELAVREHPDDRSLFERLIEAHRAAGQPEAALTVIDNLVQSDSSAALFRTRSAILFELGRESEAVADLERAYTGDPSLGQDLVEALERSIARAEPAEEGRLTLRLVEVLEAMGDLEGARGRLSEFMRSAPENLAALRHLASLDARTGHVEEAVTTLAQLVEMETGENLILAVLSLAEACELAGRPGDARFALERALAEDRKNPELRRRLRTVYQAAGAQRALAELLIEDSLGERDGARVNLLVKAGELLLGPEGDADQAVRVLETARQENPDSIELAAILARAYSAAQRNDDALTLLNSITEANRGKRSKPLGLVYREIARIHLDDGFLTDALQALTKAFELDMKNGQLAMKLGELAVEIDENEIAQRAFRAVTIMKPPGAEASEGATAEMKADANYHLAAIARRLGDPRKAKVLASKALTEKSDHERARQLLSEIEKG